MLRHRTSVAAGTLLLLFAIAPVFAHHSPSAIFDMARRISISGTLTRVEWINPHIIVTIESKGDGGKTDQWVFESNPPSWYRSVGLARADFAKAIGQTVTAEGVGAKNGTLYGYMQKIKMPDGTTLELVNSADPK